MIRYRHFRSNVKSVLLSPSILFDGMVSIVNPLGELFLFHQRKTQDIEKTDEEAIASDWIAVGNDIRWAMETYEKEMLA